VIATALSGYVERLAAFCPRMQFRVAGMKVPKTKLPKEFCGLLLRNLACKWRIPDRRVTALALYA